MADPVPPHLKSGTTTTGGGGGTSSIRFRSIGSIGELKDALNDIGNWTVKTFPEILRDLTAKGYFFADSFYPQIQNSLYELEQAGAGSVADITKVPGVLDAVVDVIKATGGSGAAGGGRSSSRTGTGGSGGSGGGGGGGSTAEDRAYASAEAQRQRDFQAQQAALDREEARRQYLLNSATRLAEQRIAERGEGRRQSIDLAGKDPFRLIASLQAKPAGEGPTPYDALKSQVRSVAEQNIPTIGPSSTVADLESAVTKMQMTNEVQGVPFTGMAMGGSLGKAGPEFGGRGYAVIVGDARPNGDEEVLIKRPEGSGLDDEVVPIIGHAADGAVLPSNPSVIPQLNLTTLPEMFNTLRGSMSGRLGITTTPSTQPARFGGGLGQIYGPITLERGLKEALVPPEEAARISNLIGQLPNPRNAANTFAYLNPAEKMAVLSAYQLAGIDNATFEALVQSAMIIGAPRRALSAAA